MRDGIGVTDGLRTETNDDAFESFRLDPLSGRASDGVKPRVSESEVGEGDAAVGGATGPVVSTASSASRLENVRRS